MLSWWNSNTTTNSTEATDHLLKTSDLSTNLLNNEFIEKKSLINHDQKEDFQKEDFQKIIKKMNELEKSVNNCHVINNLFAFETNLVIMNVKYFNKIIATYLNLISSAKRHDEKKYICLGMFYFVNDQIFKLKYIRYRKFFKTVLNKIKEPQFSNIPIFEEIICKLKYNLEKIMYDNNDNDNNVNNHLKSD